MSFLNSVATINKKLGPDTLPDLRSRALVEHAHISTGSFIVDYVTGIGGIPRGKISEFHGLQSAGKTTCALMAAAECQSGGEGVLFIDHEHSIVPSYAEMLGVSLDPAKFALYQPSSMEDGFRVAEFFMQQGGCGMVIEDSVAAMVPQSEVDGEIGDAQIGSQARAMSRALRQLKHLISTSNTAFVFINQLRDVVDLTWAGQQAAKKSVQYTTPGGRALKFFADLRLEFMPTGQEKIEGDDPLAGVGTGGKEKEKTNLVIGQKARVTAVKNKCAAPWRSAEIFLRSGKGIDSTRPCIDLAIRFGLIKGAQGYFKVPTPYCNPEVLEQTVHGRENLDQFFEACPEQLNLLFGAVWENVRLGGL